MTRRYYANAAPQQTLSGSITSGATSLAVAGSFTGWPTNFPYYACLDIGTASMEIVSVTNVVGTTATIVRAQDGTAAVSHPAGATLDQVFVRQDMDEANAHVNATSGAHGISGSFVGTSDSQTLTNKTLSSPVLTGTATGAGAINTTGAITTTQAVTGGSLSTGGNLTVTGTASVTGAATAASFTANGNGAVTGVLVPKTYTNEAAATAALGTPAAQTTVWLSTPTGGVPAGLYYWTGTAWAPVTPGFLYGEDAAHAGNSAALATIGTAVASAGFVTFTLPVQRRVRIITYATFNTASGTVPARYLIRASYNTGSSVVIGSAVAVGLNASVVNGSTGSGGNNSGAAEGTALLAAGTYTAYAQFTRNANGSATDTGFNAYVAVYDAGAV